MRKLYNIIHSVVDHKISLKELYFSLSTWFTALFLFLGFATKFNTTLLVANLVLAFYIYLILILVTNRLLLSGFLTLLLAVSFDYIKLIKWQFLMQEFSAADFFMLKLLINHGLLRLMYEYATKEIYLIFILLLLNFILLWNRYDTLLDKMRLGAKNYYALRIVSIGVAILLLSKLFDISFDKRSYFYMAIDSIKKENSGFQRKLYGPFADVVFTIPDIYIEPLEGTIDSSLIAQEVEKSKDNILTPIEEMPDIVVILNESVFNPSKLDYDFADKFNFAFFNQGKYTKYYGTLNVNTFGGSSWISEYEINTGVPHASFSGPSYMPFITLIPKTQNSIMSYLKSIGYNVEVVYPVDKNFSLAEESYTSLGADKITDVYEIGYNPDSWSKIPDRVIGDMIISALDKHPEKPKYIFAATMLNHGPHSSFTKDTIGCSLSMNDQLCSKLNDYIGRIIKTNKDQLELIDKLMKRKKKTIVVNFGDHLPSFEGFSTQLRFTKDIRNYYKTFYNINANFNVAGKEHYPALDITFIPGLILDLAKLNTNEFYLANSFMRKMCNGNFDKCEAKQPKEQRLVESYKSLITKQLRF